LDSQHSCQMSDGSQLVSMEVNMCCSEPLTARHGKKCKSSWIENLSSCYCATISDSSRQYFCSCSYCNAENL